MAWQPCLRCDQRFSGEARNVYLTYYLGGDVEAYRFVVCPEGCEEVMNEWRSRALYRNGSDEWEYHDPDPDSTPRVRHVEEAAERFRPTTRGRSRLKD